jgi:hypothetical protein
MTTTQDYIGSILQSLAAITLSHPHHEFQDNGNPIERVPYVAQA